jgi:hypothetical protein
MINSKYSGRALSLLVVLPLLLTAQRAQENVIPLKNWATPLYWQANQAEREAAGKPAPQFQLSTNAVSTEALTFVAITPCRLVDTRGSGGGFNGDTPFSGPSIPGSGTATFPVQSSSEATDDTTPAPCGVIPSTAQAYSFNLTVIPKTTGGEVGYVTLWPAGATQPVVATLNDRQGAIVNNAAIVGAGTPSGGVSVYNHGPTTMDVIIDMNGFYAAPSDVNYNTAIGTGTLESNTTGDSNTAIGFEALLSNTTGYNNTASGADALQDNTTGVGNTACGVGALGSNTTGTSNTASGSSALGSNTTGSANIAGGYAALAGNTTGSYNTASGFWALIGNTIGSDNTASGLQALFSNTTGSGNIALGYDAAFYAPAGNSNSIYIGSQGTGSDLGGTIQIGTEGTQTGGTYIAGIYGATAASGSEVYVTSSGQLGTVLSSGRFKEQITDMGDSSSKLLQLRPVNFFYKPEYDDGSHLLQYGLIAEEVAKVYPEMVAYGNDGQILTVKYQLLPPMLLNEAQKQHAEVQKLSGEAEKQNQRAQQQDETIRQLQERLAALEALLGKVPTTDTAGQ